MDDDPTRTAVAMALPGDRRQWHRAHVCDDEVMQDDAVRWDDRYREAGPIDARPPEPLDRVDLEASIPTSGTAIDIACGLGAQSLWLAARGLRVIALDVSRVAIDRVRAAADAAGLTDHVDARVVDLDDGIPEGTPNADVIVCQRFRHPQLYPAIIEHLAPGGIAIVTVLSEVGLSEVALSQPPGPFRAATGELVTAFDSDEIEILYASEAAGSATIMARRA
jgi:2-polyprenyl-3-methyl-5-hydroxy-6-metoxy-1,4-benzoquinol methylase